VTKLNLKSKNKKQKEKRESYSTEFKLDAAEKYFSRKKLSASLTPRHLSYELRYKGSRVSYSTFKRWIREYENLNKVESQKRLRSVPGKFPEVETRLVSYLTFRKLRFSTDKCGLSYQLICAKAREIADDLLKDLLKIPNLEVYKK